MDNRILIAAGVAGVVLLGGVGLLVAGMGGGTDPENPVAVEQPKPGAAPAPATATGEGDDPEAQPAPNPGGKVRPGEVVHDEEYEARAKAARERRESVNTEWRAQTTTAAQQWVANSGLDEGTGIQVMGLINKMHDTVAQSRRDLEDGVIDPRTLREEMAGAKEELRVELENLIGVEKRDALYDAMSKGKLGGI